MREKLAKHIWNWRHPSGPSWSKDTPRGRKYLDVADAAMELFILKLEQAYLAGWQESGEGWNAEYGCNNPNLDDYWLKKRNEALEELLNE